jgi:hypothetical protein
MADSLLKIRKVMTLASEAINVPQTPILTPRINGSA